MYLKERVIAGVRVETVGLILCQGSQGRSAVSTQQRQSVQVQRERGGKRNTKENALISRGLQESPVRELPTRGAGSILSGQKPASPTFRGTSYCVLLDHFEHVCVDVFLLVLCLWSAGKVGHES